ENAQRESRLVGRNPGAVEPGAVGVTEEIVAGPCLRIHPGGIESPAAVLRLVCCERGRCRKRCEQCCTDSKSHEISLRLSRIDPRQNFGRHRITIAFPEAQRNLEPCSFWLCYRIMPSGSAKAAPPRNKPAENGYRCRIRRVCAHGACAVS